MTADDGKRCPRCGAAHGGSPGEPCAACLLRLGLEDDATGREVTPVDGDLGPMPGALGNWRPLRLLGEGGMGVVYLAEEIGPLKRRAALKRIKLGLDSKRVLARFDQERKVLARMDHPGIARAIDAGTAADGTPFFVMEYVEGVPITDHCDRNRLGSRERLGLFGKLCDAVDHAHRRGILHRDLKPSNILVVDAPEGPQPKVIDFGVARAIAQQRLEWSVFTEFGRLVGTPEYMSPEQADLENDDLDTRSDVYGLGVVLYELLVGTTPHDPRSLRELGLEALLKTIREGTFPTPSSRLSTLGDEVGAIAEKRGSDLDRLRRGIAGELDWIVMRATDRDRERRYKSPSDLADDIRRYLEDRPVLAGPPGISYRMRKFARRHRGWVAIAGAAVLALLLGTAGLAIGLERALEAEAEARAAEETAREEQVRAQATSDFLVGLFRETGAEETPIRELSALEALDRGAERIREDFQEDPLLRATILQALGEAYEELELFDRSRPLLEESLELRDEHLDTKDPRLANAHLMMGVLHAEQGRYREALPYYERSIELFDASDQDLPGAVASPLRSLGNSLRRLGDLEAAEAVQRRAVEVARVHPGPESGLYGMTLDNLAGTLFYMRRLEEAESLWLQALDVQRARAPQGTSTAQTLSNLAVLYSELQDLPRAETHAREAAGIVARVFGEDHIRAASARTTLAGILRLSGRGDEAIELAERDLPLLERALGPAHDRTAGARLVLAGLHLSQQRHADAAEVLEHQIEVLAGSSPDSPYLASSYQRLASVHWGTENYEDSLEAQTKAVDLLTERTGPEHPDVGGAIAVQGWSLRKLGRLDEAFERLDKSLTILRAADPSVPSNRLHVCDNLDGFARLQADLGNHTAAVEMFEELTTTLAEVKGEDYAPLGEIYGEYARSLRALGRGDEATAMEARATRLSGGD